MAITLRQESDARATTKGTSLTFQELDNNFIDVLNRTELSVEGDTGNAQLSSAEVNDKTLVVTGAGGITTSILQESTGQATLTITNSAGELDMTEKVIGGTGIFVSPEDSTGAVTVSADFTELSQDASPQLGNDLDVNGYNITTTAPAGSINIVPNGGNVVTTSLTYSEVVYTGLATSGTLTPDPTDGSVQKVTLAGNITINALGGAPSAGDSVTLILKQDATGSRTLTSTMKFAGGTNTLSTAGDAIDVLTIFYDGTDYLASLNTDFQ